MLDDAWSGPIHLVAPCEPYEGQVGEWGGEEFGNALLKPDWLAFKLNDQGRYELLGDWRYFMLEQDRADWAGKSLDWREVRTQHRELVKLGVEPPFELHHRRARRFAASSKGHPMDIWHSAWTKNEGIDRVQNLFREAFDAEPDGVWAAPGRVNLIGEHTDYNGGLCMPIALDHRTFVAFRSRDDDAASMITGIDGETRWQGKVSDIVPGVQPDWVAYCGGVAWAISQEGLHVPGFDIAIVSCVPLGAGLSSSAALETAVALALDELFHDGTLGADDAGRTRLAAACVRAENEVAGAATGGMDQAAALRTTAGHALLIDSHDASVRQVPLDLDAAGLAVLTRGFRSPGAVVRAHRGELRLRSRVGRGTCATLVLPLITAAQPDTQE